jgi:hypothetical protein
MRLIVLTIAVFAGVNCWALTFEGTISKTKTSFSFLNKSDNKKYQLTGSTPIISTYLAKLSEGDFVSVDGSRDVVQSVITVGSINYVGLKSLIGTWYGDDNYCYTFHSNTDFTLSQRSGRKCIPTSLSYTYLLNPDSRSQGWVMLVAGEYGSYLGDLKMINAAAARLDLYANETGDILRVLNLTRKQ